MKIDRMGKDIETGAKISRRSLLRRAASFAGAGALTTLTAGSSLAETAIDRILNSNNRDRWGDQYDARSGQTARVSSNT